MQTYWKFKFFCFEFNELPVWYDTLAKDFYYLFSVHFVLKIHWHRIKIITILQLQSNARILITNKRLKINQCTKWTYFFLNLFSISKRLGFVAKSYIFKNLKSPITIIPKSVVTLVRNKSNMYSIRFVCNGTWNACWAKLKIKPKSVAHGNGKEKIPEKEWKNKEENKNGNSTMRIMCERREEQKKKC